MNQSKTLREKVGSKDSNCCYFITKIIYLNMKNQNIQGRKIKNLFSSVVPTSILSPQKSIHFYKNHNKSYFILDSSLIDSHHKHHYTATRAQKENSQVKIKALRSYNSSPAKNPTETIVQTAHKFQNRKYKNFASERGLQIAQLTDRKQQCTSLKMRETFSTQSHTPKSHTALWKIQEYSLIDKIGEGRFGSVYLAVHKQTGFIGALKVIKKAEVTKLPSGKRQQIISQIMSQIKLQSFLSHPNLIQLYDFFSDNQNIYLFVQIGTQGNLFDLLGKKGKISEESTSIIIRQITLGIKYMHSKCVMHRDLKLENIVFNHGMAKICDFGWSVYEPKEFRKTLCGTPLYLSPQILIGKKYSSKADIWALGILSHELFTGETPFKITTKKHLDKIITQDFQINAGSPQIKSFISFILKKQPQRRPDADILLRHPFIHKYEQIETSEQICHLADARKSKFN